MKNLFLTVLILPALFSMARAQSFKPVEGNSTVSFKVSHQMIFKSTVKGSFKGFKGAIIFEPKNPSASTFDVSIEAKTINSGIGMRDNDLRKEKYFNVEKYPLITIKSKAITKGPKENEYFLSGTLTIKGKTLPLSFAFSAVLKGNGYVFTGNFQINRLDYNIGPDNSIDKVVEVSLAVEAK